MPQTEIESPFRQYVLLARVGRWGIPSILIGIGLTAILWIASTFGIILASTAAATWMGNAPPLDQSSRLEALLDGRSGVVFTLLTIAALWGVMWIVLRLVHRRPLPTLLGASRRIDWTACGKALLAGVLVLGLISLATPAPEHLPFVRSPIALSDWLVLLLPLAALIALQCSAEELVFRGYLMQSLASRFTSPLVWALIPLLLFTVGHWDFEAQTHMLAAILGSIIMFGAAATFLVVRTGNLGASIGVHTATNLFAFLVTSPKGDYDAFSLYTYPPLSDPAWTVADAVWLVAFEATYLAATLVLLLHRRSPLRLAGCAAADME